MGPLPSASSTDEAKLQDAEYRVSLRHFEKKASTAYAACLLDSNPLEQWFKFAAITNTIAAFEFECIAEAVRDLQGEDNAKGEYAKLAAPEDPIEYLEAHQFSIIQRWHDIIKEWEREWRQQTVYADEKRWRLELASFHQASIFIRSRIPRLKDYMVEEKFDQRTSREFDPANYGLNNCKLRSIVAMDPSRAWRAVRNMEPKLVAIEQVLEEFVDKARNNIQNIDTLQQETGLRRRQKRRSSRSNDTNSSSIEDVETESNPASDSTIFGIPVSSTLETLKSIFSLPSRYLSSFSFPTFRSNVILAFLLDQTTHWILALICTSISGLLIGLSITQSRPPTCNPQAGSFDDGFWTQMSQVVLQLLSLYCTVVPLMRDRHLPVRPFWFCTALVVSAVTAVLEPVVYGFSWRANALVGYVSEVAALVASAQLAGGVQQAGLGIDLGMRESVDRRR